MQSGSRLVIHTALSGEASSADAPSVKRPKGPRAILSILPKRAAKARARRRAPRHTRKASGGERLMRNTAIACALLMGVVAVSRIDSPLTNRVTEAVSSALNQRVDPDETLGRLNFVKNLMPDSALVFWNMGTDGTLARPVTGAVSHAWTPEQPYLEYQVSGSQPVYAAAKGRIAALSKGSAGDWTLLIDHDDGRQSVYAFLDSVLVKSGERVERGKQIGKTKDETDGRLYFELRKDSVPEDPGASLTGA